MLALNAFPIFRKPKLTELPQGRIRVERWFNVKVEQYTWYKDNTSPTLRCFGGFGLLDGLKPGEPEDTLPFRKGNYIERAFPNCRLVAEEVDYYEKSEAYVLYQVYETLLPTWAKEDADIIKIGRNGLTTLIRRLIARPGTDPADAVLSVDLKDAIGTEKLDEGYVLSEADDGSSDDRAARLVLTYQKPGLLSIKSRDSYLGRLDTTTVSAWAMNRAEIVEAARERGHPLESHTLVNRTQDNIEGLPAVSFIFVKGEGEISTEETPGPIALSGAIRMTITSIGTPVEGPDLGTLVGRSSSRRDGHMVYVRSYLQGEITGMKREYMDTIEVMAPGVVTCKAEQISLDDIVGGSHGSVVGTKAIFEVKPKQPKPVTVKVTVEVTTAPPDNVDLAFDLSNVYCSVATMRAHLTTGPGVITSTDTITEVGYRKGFGGSVNIHQFPGCYLSAESKSSQGSVKYISEYTPYRQNKDSNVISSRTSYAYELTKCIGSGSTSLDGYQTAGVIRRRPRPIYVAMDGTTFYEVITWATA